MSRIASASTGIRWVILPLVIALVLGWAAATAHAQETPADDQYGSPTETESSGAGDPGDPADPGDPGSGVLGASDSGSAASGVGDPGSGASGSNLPVTGGPSLLLVALGVLALGGTGLLAARRSARR